MRRLLGRLRNKNGSVLFLVVMVMSLLVIAASATFYIVNNQRNAVTVKYSSEQSYQWATSVSKTVSSYIDGYANKLRGCDVNAISDNILKKIIDLPKDKSFNADLDLIQGSGSDKDVIISVTKLKIDETDDGVIHTYAISSTSKVNGETVTVTEYKTLIIKDYVPIAEPFTRFLTSTGYRPENCFLEAKEILTETYFENEYTCLGEPNQLNSSTYIRGTLSDRGINYPIDGLSSGTEVVVSQNFYIETDHNRSVTADKIYVGGDMSSTRYFVANEVYVLGNLHLELNASLDNGSGDRIFYVNGDCTVDGVHTKGATFYVNGNLYIKGEKRDQGKFYVKGNIIDYNGSSFEEKNTVSSQPFTDEKIEEIKNHIYEKTSKQNYQTWDAEKYFDKNYKEAPTITPGAGSETSGSVCTIKQSCVLQQASDSWGDKNNEHIILIDASDNEIFIKLQPSGSSKSFYFYSPLEGENVDVIIKGTHPVVFIIPDGVDFVNNGFIGHGDLVYKMAYDQSNDEEKTAIKASAGSNYTDKIVNYIKNNNIKNVAKTYFKTENKNILANLITTTTDNAGKRIVPIYDKNKFTEAGITPNIHNNIFLVTSGKENTIYFDTINKETFCFCGFVYAPNTVLSFKGTDKNIALIGGMITGSYTFTNREAEVAFLAPYDYYKTQKYVTKYGKDYDPASLVKYLMESSGGLAGNGLNDSDDVKYLVSFETLGYK